MNEEDLVFSQSYYGSKQVCVCQTSVSSSNAEFEMMINFCFVSAQFQFQAHDHIGSCNSYAFLIVHNPLIFFWIKSRKMFNLFRCLLFLCFLGTFIYIFFISSLSISSFCKPFFLVHLSDFFFPFLFFLFLFFHLGFNYLLCFIFPHLSKVLSELCQQTYHFDSDC